MPSKSSSTKTLARAAAEAELASTIGDAGDADAVAIAPVEKAPSSLYGDCCEVTVVCCGVPTALYFRGKRKQDAKDSAMKAAARIQLAATRDRGLSIVVEAENGTFFFGPNLDYCLVK